MDIFIVMSQEYLAPIVPPDKYWQLVYGEIMDINDFCTILKQIHHGCTKMSYDLARF